MLDFVREIQDAVLFANGIRDWDWLEGSGRVTFQTERREAMTSRIGFCR